MSLQNIDVGANSHIDILKTSYAYIFPENLSVAALHHTPDWTNIKITTEIISLERKHFHISSKLWPYLNYENLEVSDISC